MTIREFREILSQVEEQDMSVKELIDMLIRLPNQHEEFKVFLQINALERKS